MTEQNDVNKEVWDAKDRLHAYQTALNVAGINNTGLGKPTEDIIKEADRYYQELIQAKMGANGGLQYVKTIDNVKEGQTVEYAPKFDVTQTAEKGLTLDEIPIPTLEQKNIFQKLAEDTNMSYTLVVTEIWKKKHSLVIENVEAAKKYLLGLKG